MDTTQLAQMVTWLDEQHRRDREELTKLQQRVEAQTGAIQEQARRIKSLETQLSSAKMQLGRFEQIDESLKNMRNELTLMVNAQADNLAKTRRELEQSRMSDREGAARAIAEVRKELDRIRRLEEEQAIRKTEVQRLSDIALALRYDLNNINKDIDERTRGLPYMMEQRNHDNRRIAQLQQENIELFKRLETSLNKLQLLEYKLQKVEGALEPLPESVEEVKRTQAQFIESLKLADADRQRQMAEWQDVIDSQMKLFDEQQQRFNTMLTLKDDIHRAMVSLEKFRESVRREQEQVASLQRLAEERMKKEMETFQADNEKLRKKQLLEWQYRWDEQTKVNVAVNERFPIIQNRLNLFDEILQLLWSVLDEQSQARLRESQKWLSQIHVMIEEREKIYKKYKEPAQSD